MSEASISRNRTLKAQLRFFKEFDVQLKKFVLARI